jgi:PAS domain S-box-containing protein
VDDDEALVQTLGDILELHGYESVGARNGREGLSAMSGARRPIAVALVDLRLPDMDGIALTTQLHLLSQQTQVIILTGNASVESAVEALRQGSQDYLVKPINPEQLLQTVGSAQDRFQRLSAEHSLRATHERHRMLLEGLSEVILVLDPDGRIAYASPAADRLLGYASNAWAGRSVFDVIHTDDVDRIRATLAKRVAAGKVSAPLTFRIRHADRRWRTVEAEVVNYLDRPEVGGLVVTVRDVTETRALEGQLADARRIDSIGRLAGGVAHDFNNLLTVMMASIDLLDQEVPTTSPMHAELKEIRHAATSAARLTRQLLAFGRRQVMEAVVLDLNDLIREGEELLRRMLREDIEVELKLTPESTAVRADPTQIQQVLLNLIVNARDAMPKGGRITIETRVVTLDEEFVQGHTSARPGPHVLLAVTDTGIGMDEATRARLFEPFFTTKEEGSGTGLGLATVHGIVHQSGGHIWVYSERGMGTTFKVYLPLVLEAPVAAQVGSVVGRGKRGGSERVLVVEDNEPVRRLIRTMLSRAGYVVHDFERPAAALAEVAAGAFQPQLLVSDVVLPGMPGRTMADRLRVQIPNLPVLFISGFSHGAIEFHGTPVAPEHFLAKPFTGDELLERVRRVLDKADARTE